LPLPFDGKSGSQICELDPILHDLLPLFACSRYWATESEGDSEERRQANAYMDEYYSRKAERLKLLLKRNKEIPREWIVY
jgi:hypothetical protein